MEVDSDEDLTKELQPLAYYVSDRKRVLKEALRTLKGKRLEAMIPPALKSWDRARLESACLNVLEDVDDETLLSILDGRVGTAASAAVEQPEPEEPVVKEKIKKTKNKLKKVKSVETPEVPDEPKKKKKKKAVVVQESVDEAKMAKLKKKKKLLKAKKLKEKLKKKRKAAAAGQPTEVDGEPSAAAPHKSLMELLELEYRAKAIKALLRSQGQTVPDIPLDVEGEEEQENEPVEKPPPSKATPEKKKVNGEKVKKSTAKPKESKSTPVTNVPVKTTTSKKVETSKAITTAVVEKVSPKKSTSTAKASTAAMQQKVPPKKAVIDLIDDALSTSFSEVTPDVAVAVIEPPAVIVQAISNKDSATEEDLRSKLLKKYQQQKQVVEVKTEKPQVKRKVKKKKEIPKDEEDDVLELHPQELSLDGEDRGEEQESSEDEVEEEEESEEIGDKEESNKKANVQEEEEQLIYDDDTDEEEEETQKETDQKVEDQEENSNSSAKEEKLWATVEEGTKVEEDNITTDNELSQGGPPSDNSRSGVFSETTRDDVFETAVVGNVKGKVAGVSFSNVGGGFKKKLTFRIDPARIKALEEQGVEEEAKRDEERKKQEEEERLKRLAEEPEEGELDSNEEDIVSEEEEEKKTPQKKEVSKSPSKSPARSMKRRDHSDSEDSQDSTSYYAKRRPYKRKQASPSRDFGKYSPQRNVTLERQSPEKRPSSPVDFITQFSDMEPISDEDSNQSQPKKKVGPVQGCSERPANAVESDSEEEEDKSKSDLKASGNKAASEEDEDELPKPVTWYERWAQSHGMSKVVKANNIHRKVKSKLKQTKKQPEVPKVPEPSVEAEPIIGSIEEYEKLFGKKVVIKSSEQEDNNTKSNEAQDEEEEEDADDLWGDILGGGDSD